MLHVARRLLGPSRAPYARPRLEPGGLFSPRQSIGRLYDQLGLFLEVARGVCSRINSNGRNYPSLCRPNILARSPFAFFSSFVYTTGTVVLSTLFSAGNIMRDSLWREPSLPTFNHGWDTYQLLRWPAHHHRCAHASQIVCHLAGR